jgi:hypothetical protein
MTMVPSADVDSMSRVAASIEEAERYVPPGLAWAVVSFGV